MKEASLHDLYLEDIVFLSCFTVKVPDNTRSSIYSSRPKIDAAIILYFVMALTIRNWLIKSIMKNEIAKQSKGFINI